MSGETESYFTLLHFHHAFTQYCFCMSVLKREAVGHVSPTGVEVFVPHFKIL